ncbi:Hypothetical predicted protein [Pelobates cultripes]|uniref:Uncharacterized protein n=1 Tax=Pelobates cultripes TaxID=61616 RepID=A0AAD1WXQ4_PELCU|nr:Hypothetical predicted protein [Pelobates cultripes]
MEEGSICSSLRADLLDYEVGVPGAVWRLCIAVCVFTLQTTKSLVFQTEPEHVHEEIQAREATVNEPEHVHMETQSKQATFTKKLYVHVEFQATFTEPEHVHVEIQARDAMSMWKSRSERLSPLSQNMSMWKSRPETPSSQTRNLFTGNPGQRGHVLVSGTSL